VLFDGEGQYDGGAVLQPPPEGIWGMPREKLEQLTEYGLDVSRSHEEARAMMRLLGYGPDARLKVKVSARNIVCCRDTGAILMDQLKEIWIDRELERAEPANCVPKLMHGSGIVLAFSFASAVTLCREARHGGDR
jgi:peptide/nickel transport system substrate-binding protein